jgi:hypothetical protein
VRRLTRSMSRVIALFLAVFLEHEKQIHLLAVETKSRAGVRSPAALEVVLARMQAAVASSERTADETIAVLEQEIERQPLRQETRE